MLVASSLEDVMIRISSTYLEKKMHERQVLSAVRSSLSMYVMASRPERLDPIGKPEVCL